MVCHVNAYVCQINTTAKFSSSSIQDNRAAPVKLLPCGDIIKLRFEDSNKFAGILNLPVLCRLFDDFTVKLQASLIIAPGYSSKLKTGKGKSSVKECKIRIVVCGMKDDKAAVGRLLSDADLYLQHPSALECVSAEYCNPHYLRRPGSEMPKLEDLSLSTNHTVMSRRDLLDEVDMARLLRTFDSTGDDGTKDLATIDPSPRLNCTLMV